MVRARPYRSDRLAPVDFSRLNPTRVVVGGIASLLLIASVLFMPWYSLTHDAFARHASSGNFDAAWVCGTNDYSCTGFETFPLMRWLLLLAALAPLILAYILVRGHRLSWPPGEMTMVAGFAAAVLIIYNGIIDKPGGDFANPGLSLDYGYWVALVAAIVIGGTGFTRSQQGQRRVRKAPGTV
jgi:hypothetical protein